MATSPAAEDSQTTKPTNTPCCKTTKSNQKIHHVTEINAPIEAVWKALVNVNDWSWNKWTRLEAGIPAVGLQGTLLACYEGDFSIEFAEVDPNNHVLAWQGSVGPFDGRLLFKGYHSMRLEEIEESEANTNTNTNTNTTGEKHDNKPKRQSSSKTSGHNSNSGKRTRRTRLVHTETFRGLLPFFSLGLPYETLNRNYLLMNESLKKFVEDQQPSSSSS
eukprot:CAMPEP_0172382080 /NCGR_PEP_ID=MMETSP1061-20121228/77_1 /TAXON_ID=37318 /ORGANISM="Pseudo-nitzschia pungens, Strain cf. pungens" /LENGTH=217 /DNA_ID=CAMNT_0013109889 /DNA_START=295 /DNA_END=949 /DNA_ORIENTATION=-